MEEGYQRILRESIELVETAYSRPQSNTLRSGLKPVIIDTTVVQKEMNSVDIMIDAPVLIGTGASLKDLKMHISKLTNFVHDFTFSILSEETDVPMKSVFGIIGDGADNHTPDCILQFGSKFVVVEFTTTRNDTKEGVKFAFQKKILAYENSLQTRSKLETVSNILYIIIVVSQNYVCTNFAIDEELKEELCYRFRVSLELEQKFVNLGLVDAEIDTDLKQRTKEVSNTIQSIKFDWEQTKNFPPFSKESYEHWIKPTNDEDKEFTRSAIKKSFEQAQTEIKEEHKPHLPEKERNSYNLKKYFESSTRLIEDMLEGDRRSKFDKKSVCQFPFVVLKAGSGNISIRDTEMTNLIKRDIGMSDDSTFELWSNVVNKVNEGDMEQFESDPDIELQRALDETNEDSLKQMRNKYHRVKFELSEESRINLAKVGFLGKAYKDDAGVQNYRESKKLPFAFDSDVSDIDRFINESGSIFQNICYDEVAADNQVRNLIKLSLDHHNTKVSETVVSFLDSFQQSYLGRYTKFVSDVATELAISLRQHCTHKEVIFKKLKDFDCYIIIKPTDINSHLFYSLLWHKDQILFQDDESLFPFKGIHSNDEVCWTDFCSVNQSKLVNLCKCDSLMLATASYWCEFYQIPFWMENPYNTEQFGKMLSVSLLVLMNDKSKTEEHLTLFRYISMEGFTNMPLVPRPNKMFSKFDTIPRDRMQLWVQKKLVAESERIVRTGGYKQNKTDGRITWTNLWNPFTNSPLDNVHQLISLYYIGYYKNKDETPEKNTMSKMVKKILEWEDNIPDDKLLGTENPPLEKPPLHSFSPSLIKIATDKAKKFLKSTMGSTFEEQIKTQILNDISYLGLENFSTLKASSTFDSKEVYNKEKRYKRQKVIVAVSKLLDDKATAVFDLLPKALDFINSNGCLHIDIFKKPQHGGLREIYVLGICERICQSMVEQISRTLCGYFPSEIMTNPENKFRISENHSKLAKNTFNEHYVTMATSDDAKKWNQGHFVSKFAMMLVRMTDPLFHPLIIRTLQLWMKKRIMLDPHLIDIIEKNININVSDKYFQRVHDAYLGKGDEKWLKQNQNHLETRSGMMQGILHYTSSLLHTIFLNYYREIILVYMIDQRKNLLNEDGPTIVSHQQSSDDSSVIISIKAESLREVRIAWWLTAVSFVFKKTFGIFFGIYESEKSTKNTLNCMEFNSEYIFGGDLYRPTLRWITACCSISETESLASRQEELSTLLTTIVEGGGSFLLSSLCQVAQAILAYRLLGSSTSPIFAKYSMLIHQVPDPSLGYFLMDHPNAAGLFGFKFNLWNCVRQTTLGVKYTALLDNIVSEKSREILDVTNSGTFVQAISIGWGNRKKWQRLVKDMGVPENWVEQIDSDPEILYRRPRTGEELFLRLSLKINSPGVSESLSKGNVISRVIASSVYIMARGVLSDKNSWYSEIEEKSKISLIKLVLKDLYKYSSAPATLDWNKLSVLFPFVMDYQSVLNNLKQFDTLIGYRIRGNPRKVTNKIKIMESDGEQIFLPESLAAEKWFGLPRIMAASRVKEQAWLRLKQQISWLEDTVEETLIKSPFEHHHQLANFLSRLDLRKRSVKVSGAPVSTKLGLSYVTAMCQDFFSGFKYDFKFDEKKAMESQDASDVLHIIQGVISFPFTEEYREKFLVKALFEMDPIRFSYNIVKSRRNALSIIQRKIQNSATDSEILEMLYNNKVGIIGGYKLAQRFDTKKGKYVGFGVWIGRFDMTTVTIEVNSDNDGTYITKITVDRIPDQHLFIKTLKNWCWEQDIENRGVKYGGECLIKVNNFLMCSPTAHVGCPIIVDVKKKFTLLDDDIKNLTIIFKRNTIAMVGNLKNSKKPMTLISFTSKETDFKSGFWLKPTFPSFLDHKLFRPWLENKPLENKELLEFMLDKPEKSRLEEEKLKIMIGKLFKSSLRDHNIMLTEKPIELIELGALEEEDINVEDYLNMLGDIDFEDANLFLGDETGEAYDIIIDFDSDLDLSFATFAQIENAPERVTIVTDRHKFLSKVVDWLLTTMPPKSLADFVSQRKYKQKDEKEVMLIAKILSYPVNTLNLIKDTGNLFSRSESELDFPEL